MSLPLSHDRIQSVLDQAVAQARAHHAGTLASYIPELARVDPELTSVAITLVDGTCLTAGEAASHRFTLQSVAKLILLLGMVEEFGENQVFSWIGVEPSGSAFASVAQLDFHGPVPPNPLVNAGAIALCSHLPGTNMAERFPWVEKWAERLLGARPSLNARVFESERRTGDRNRALAYLMKSNGVISGDVEDVLDTYFAMCSLETSAAPASHLAMILANGGLTAAGLRLLSRRTVSSIVAIMATCGLYDESGSHLVRTGLPAKSGVSGVIVAVATGCGGIAVASPRINSKGGSVRGHVMLEFLARQLGWHFALPR